MFRITRNIIKCKKCGEVIESLSVHDFKFSKCGAVAVDGGHEYLRRCGNSEDWEELSEKQEWVFPKIQKTIVGSVLDKAVQGVGVLT